MSCDFQAMRGGVRVVRECFGSIMPSEGSPRIGTEDAVRFAFPHVLERCNRIAKHDNVKENGNYYIIIGRTDKKMEAPFFGRN